jgi:hypothetical protein
MTDTATSSLDPRRAARRRLWERVWGVLGIAYAVFRIWLAQVTVHRYDVWIPGFAAIELLTAWPHGLATARVITALIDRDRVRAWRWGIVLAVTHVAPELYIALDATYLPRKIWASLAFFVFGFGALSLWGIVQKVRDGRRARAAAAEQPPQHAGPTGVTDC